MSRTYLPNSKQFQRINEHLKTIAGALGTQVDISTWEGVQKIVKMGLAPKYFPVGSQLVVNHSVYGDMIFDVVAHDYLKSAKDKNAHTMTILSRDILPSMQMDSPEAFYYAENGLPPGTYNFTIAATYGSWVAGTYQFTLPYALPVGGQLCIPENITAPLTSATVTIFSSCNEVAPTQSAEITTGSEGVSLGTFDNELNHRHRVVYGSNNYKESAIRQFLNSSEIAGNVWTPQTKYDRPPTWVNTHAGFMSGLDTDFLSVVGEVVVPCSTNNTFELIDSNKGKGEKYTVVDKFYLASQQEIFGTAVSSVEDDSRLLPYYESATNAERIKYRDGVAVGWRLRSPVDGNAHNVRLVHIDGSLRNDFAHLDYGFAIACTIV